MDYEETGCDGAESIQMAEDRAQWWIFCKHFNKFSGSIISGDFLENWITTFHERPYTTESSIREMLYLFVQVHVFHGSTIINGDYT